MRPEDRRTIAVAGFLHAGSQRNLPAIPIFLTAWSELITDPFVLGLLAATAYACFGLASVPFGLLADRRPARPMRLLCEGAVAVALAGLALSPNLPALATCLSALGPAQPFLPDALFSASGHPSRPRALALWWQGFARFAGRDQAGPWVGCPARVSRTILIMPSGSL